MKLLLFAVISPLATFGVCFGEEAPTIWISWVDGVRYECSATPSKIRESGGPVMVETAPHEHAISENLGAVTLVEAINRADKVAREVLGKAYTGNDPIWVMRNAERCEHGEDGSDGGFYRISYNPRRTLRDKSGGSANLQVIVLLNGEVLTLSTKP